jgi:hypothetical protein
MHDLEIAARARRGARGAKKLAILLFSHGHQITPQAISQWKKIPAERAHLISELTGIAAARWIVETPEYRAEASA